MFLSIAETILPASSSLIDALATSTTVAVADGTAAGWKS